MPTKDLKLRAECWVFRLYINGRRAESRQLLEVLEHFCQKFLREEGLPFELTVIDVIEKPEIAMRDRVLATPTLYFHSGRRAQRLVGSFNEVDLFRICFLNALRARGPRESKAQVSNTTGA